MIWTKIKRSLKSDASTTPALTPQTTDATVSSSTRALLKQARSLRNVQRYSEACDKLLEALSAKDAKHLSIKERLLLPRYMQLAGNKEQGWELLNNMMVVNDDAAAQVEIIENMSRFLYREGNRRQALLYTVWKVCKEIERDNLNLQSIMDVTDKEASASKGRFFFKKKNAAVQAYGATQKGNAITDPLYRLLKERIASNTSHVVIRSRIEEPVRQLQLPERAEALAREISGYVETTTLYQLSEVRGILNAHLA